MSKIRFTQTPAQKRAMDQLLKDAASKVQVQATASAQDIVREVDDAMRGRPVNEVQKELESRLMRLGLRPSPGLAEYAQAISDGTLER